MSLLRSHSNCTECFCATLVTGKTERNCSNELACDRDDSVDVDEDTDSSELFESVRRVAIALAEDEIWMALFDCALMRAANSSTTNFDDSPERVSWLVPLGCLWTY